MVNRVTETRLLGLRAEKLTSGGNRVVSADLHDHSPEGSGGRKSSERRRETMEMAGWLWKENRETEQQLQGAEGIREGLVRFGCVLFLGFAFFFFFF